MESPLVQKNILSTLLNAYSGVPPLTRFLFFFFGAPLYHTQLAMRVCGPDSVEVAAYARCLAQMSEDYSQFLSPGLPRPFYMPNPVPLYRQTLTIIEKVIGPEDSSVSHVFRPGCSVLRHRA